MPTHGQRLGKKISDVPDTGNVLDAELEATNPILEPMEAHVAGFDILGLMVQLARPTATSLSQWIVVGGCG